MCANMHVCAYPHLAQTCNEESFHDTSEILHLIISLNLCYVFETETHLPQAGLKLTLPCFSLLGAWITDVCHLVLSYVFHFQSFEVGSCHCGCECNLKE